MKAIKTKLSAGSLARAALVAGVLLTAHVASAATVTTTSAASDLFVGFRQNGLATDLVADIGSLLKYTPTSLGGTWNGSSFQVQFGVIPTTSTQVFNLNTDLASVFGGSWASNPSNGTGVHWGVAGLTDPNNDNTPINGWAANSIYLTKARAALGTQTTAPLNAATSVAGSAIYSFEVGSNGYTGRNSTANSSVAITEALGSNSNAWSAQIGSQSSAFGSGIRIEQALSGNYSGPTNSILDLWVAPDSNSNSTTARYLGSFSLDSSGTLTYGAVPEPSTYALLAIAGTIFMVFIRRRNRLNNSLN